MLLFTCSAAWSRDCRAAHGQNCQAPPADCFHCSARAADPCGNMCGRNANQPSASTFCGFNITTDNKATCCAARGGPRTAPATCFGCFSRLNPPPSDVHCDRPTPPPGQSTRAPVAHCGDLEIVDAETCDKFCADPNDHEGTPENGKWTPDPDGAGRRKATCCCFAPGTQRPSTCCVDTDSTPVTQPPAAECSVTGPCTQKGLTVLRNASFADACKKQTFDCDFDAPPGTPEFENCEAVETFLRAAYGNTGDSSFLDCCQCLKNSLTQWGGARLLQQLYPQAYQSIIPEINSVDCNDDDADDD